MNPKPISYECFAETHGQKCIDLVGLGECGCDCHKPGEVDEEAYRGDPNCSDCLTMTHCETHHKDVGTYPFDPPTTSAPPEK